MTYKLNGHLNFNLESLTPTKLLKLNVRGTIFEIEESCIAKHPGTLLTDLLLHLRRNNDQRRSLYFNRDPDLFNCILSHYTTGRLHFRHSMCRYEVQQELEFWGIDVISLAPCCWVWYGHKESLENKMEKVKQKSLEGSDDANIQLLSKGTCRWHLYMILEKPNYSFASKIWSWFIIFVILLSILGMVLESLPALRQSRDTPLFVFNNQTNPNLLKRISRQNMTRTHIALPIIEFFTNAIFTIEIILRFSVSPNKKKFFKYFLNFIDTLACIPPWIFLIVYDELGLLNTPKITISNAVIIGFALLRVARLLRIFRLFRLIKLNSTIRIVFLSWMNSYKELLLLSGLLVVMSVLYGSLIYYIESSETLFQDIPTGMWWAIITMTTVGYGDQSPVTPPGYIVGVVCAITGLIVVATPIPVIVNNFSCLAEAVDINQNLHDRKQQVDAKEVLQPSQFVMSVYI